MNRVTLRFNSDKGGNYLYDDVTGNIFPWSLADDAILNQELGARLTDSERSLLGSAPPAEIRAKTNQIQMWRTNYQAFARDLESSYPVPSVEEVRQAVWGSSQVLLLFV